jgi:hypothetical protein
LKVTERHRAWAQRIAALIVDDGQTDWQRARQKAGQALGLGRAEMGSAPKDELIIAAIREHLAIFYAKEQPLQLAAQRQVACDWMRRLHEYEPRLTGPVAEGWAHSESKVVIEVSGIDDKALAIWLLNHGIEAEPVGKHSSTGECDIADGGHGWPVRLRVLTPGKPRPHAERLRLKIEDVLLLLNNPKDPHAT